MRKPILCAVLLMASPAAAQRPAEIESLTDRKVLGRNAER
jgi:hypothetical protein